MAVGKRVIYSGRVQGVGFRYTVRQLTERWPVAGFVKNLRSGQVELVVEGEEAAVTDLMAAITSRMEGYISKAEVQSVELQGFADFRIEH